MPAVIETIDGVSLYAGSRELPWHHLGTTLDKDLTVEEGLDLAWLSGWNVRTEPLTVATGAGLFPMPRHQIILRDNPATGDEEPIAPIGKVFAPVQNEELAEFAAAILDDSDLVLDAAGSLDSGRRVFLTLRKPEVVKFGGIDATVPYLLLATGHDGGLATIVKPTWVRVVCQNTLTAALRGVGRTFSVRHTGSAIHGKVQQAREALDIQFKGQTALDAEIDRLLDVTVTDEQWAKVVEQLAPMPSDLTPAGQTRRETLRDDLWTLWNADTQAPIGKTAWAAVNTIGEYFDWYGPGKDNADKRAKSQMFGTREGQKAVATRKALVTLGAYRQA